MLPKHTMRKTLLLLGFVLIALFSQAQYKAYTIQATVSLTADSLLIVNGDTIGHFHTLGSDTIVDKRYVDELFTGTYVEFSDSTITFITPSQLSDSLSSLPGGHDAVTLATSATNGGLSLVGQQIGFKAASTSQAGYLTSGNFNIFNNKLGVVSHDATLSGSGTTGSPLSADTSIVALRSWVEAQEYLTNIYLHYDSLSGTPTIPIISDIAYGAGWNDNLDGASKNAIYDAIQAVGSTGTDLTYEAYPDSGRILSSTGDDIKIPAGSTVNASLMLPADKEYLDVVDDSLANHRTAINTNISDISALSDSIDVHRPLIDANTGKDTTGIYHVNRALLDALSASDTTRWGQGGSFSESDPVYAGDSSSIVWFSDLDTLSFLRSVDTTDVIGLLEFVENNSGEGDTTNIYNSDGEISEERSINIYPNSSVNFNVAPFSQGVVIGGISDDAVAGGTTLTAGGLGYQSGTISGDSSSEVGFTNTYHEFQVESYRDGINYHGDVFISDDAIEMKILNSSVLDFVEVSSSNGKSHLFYDEYGYYLSNKWGTILDTTGVEYINIDQNNFKDSTIVPKYYVNQLISDSIASLDTLDITGLQTFVENHATGGSTPSLSDVLGEGNTTNNQTILFDYNGGLPAQFKFGTYSYKFEEIGGSNDLSVSYGTYGQVHSEMFRWQDNGLTYIQTPLIGYNTSETAGVIRFNTNKFEGYNGSSWVRLDSASGSGSMVYPGAGIPLSTGSAWGTSITNNSSNWNTAYGWGDHSSAGYMELSDFDNDSDGDIDVAAGGTNIDWYSVGDILYASGNQTLAKLSAGTDGYVLTSNGAGTAPSWQASESSKWTDNGTIIYPTGGEDVRITGETPSLFFVDTTTDEDDISINVASGTFYVYNDTGNKLLFSAQTESRDIVLGGYGSGNITGTAAYNLEVESDGTVIETTAGSDYRKKKDFKLIDNSLEKILKLNTYQFNWRDSFPDKAENELLNIKLQDDNNFRESAGVIAQEIEKVIPEAVKYYNNGYWGVDYNVVVTYLVEATKEQQKQIDNQVRQNNLQWIAIGLLSFLIMILLMKKRKDKQ